MAFLRPSAAGDNLIAIKAQGGEEKQLTKDEIIFGGYIYGPFNRYEINRLVFHDTAFWAFASK